MAQKYMVTVRRDREPVTGTQLADEMREARARVVMPLSASIIVDISDTKATSLATAGYRVKRLGDSTVLNVSGHRIDITAPPSVPRNLDVPSAQRTAWRHYLVQFEGPLQTEWFDALRDKSIDIVEPIPPFGLFVIGEYDRVQELKSLPFVAWIGHFKPAYRISPRLQAMKGTIRYVNIGVVGDGDVAGVLAAIEQAGGTVVQIEEAERLRGGRFVTIVAELRARFLAKIARMTDVRWLDLHPESVLYDERACQIAYEDLDANPVPNTGPNAGYATNLTALALSGAGITVAICDSGIDTHNNANMQADLAGRMTFFADQTGGATPVDRNGHGTHVAGIAVGNGATGDTDPAGFVLGQGVAPAANFGSINAIAGGVPINLNNWVQTAVNNGSEVMNNSWGTSTAGVALFNQGYTNLCRAVDQLVRDPDANSAGLESLCVVWAAGNSGPNLNTMGEPAEAKNTIVVGNSLNFRPGEGDLDDIRGLRGSSGRGPAVDGRILPTVVAPGTNVISARPGPTVDSTPGTPGIQQPRNPYTDTGGTVHQNHYSNNGTSMAAPHVAGLCGLLIEWWRARANGKTPSAAMLKALLVNGAEDVAGGPDRRGGTIANIPNNDQGWGRVSLENMVLQAPGSDRGPKLFLDQRHAFTATNQEYLIRVVAADPARPLRVTLVWTDAAAAALSNPALVNDLDLEVLEVNSGSLFRGNVFANGFSVAGGLADDTNNVECVYIQNPQGTYEVSVVAANLTASARPDVATPWQDFALVIDNAEVPSVAPVSVVPVIDRSGSMAASGYVDITRTSSRQFVDLMSVDDRLAAVSFGTTGTVEYPTGASPTLQTIAGQATRDAAKNRIDAMAFGGCTYMGDGIVKARDLLAGATGSRAIVLLSDGYDNKGCDASNAAKPSALDAAASLPVDLPIYSCAMGPTSDQTLLAQLADDTNGRYYYMPTIDDLFEIYNYIRGQVTGQGVIVNESGTASQSHVRAFVDACAKAVTFTVAWREPKIHYVPRDPRAADEISVRLRDPLGRRIPDNDSDIRRVVGEGYVIFKIQEPTPGAWSIEVATNRDEHTRYTVGGFVESPIALTLPTLERRLVAGKPLRIVAQALDTGGPISGIRTAVTVVAPELDLQRATRKYAQQLKKLRVKRDVAVDMPDMPGRLTLLRAQMLERGVDILPHRRIRVDLIERSNRFLEATGLVTHFRGRGDVGIRPGNPSNGAHSLSSVGLLPTPPPAAARPDATGVLLGYLRDTSRAGSYNVIVTASGFSPGCDTPFVRKELVSVLVGN